METENKSYGQPLVLNTEHAEAFGKLLSPAMQIIYNTPITYTKVTTEVEGKQIELNCLYFGRTIIGEVNEAHLASFAAEINRIHELGLVEHGSLAQLIKMQLCHTWLKPDGTLLYPDYGPEFKNAQEAEFEGYPKAPDRYIICYYVMSRYKLAEAQAIYSPLFAEGDLPGILK